MADRSLKTAKSNVEQTRRGEEYEVESWSVPVQGLGEGLMRLGHRLRLPSARNRTSR